MTWKPIFHYGWHWNFNFRNWKCLCFITRCEWFSELSHVEVWEYDAGGPFVYKNIDCKKCNIIFKKIFLSIFANCMFQPGKCWEPILNPSHVASYLPAFKYSSTLFTIEIFSQALKLSCPIMWKLYARRAIRDFN